MYIYDLSKIKNIRSKLLEIDKFLEIGDMFKIVKDKKLTKTHGNFVRSNMQIRNAVFNTLRNIELRKEDDDFLYFKKIKNYRNYNKSLTLGIITNGDRDDDLKNLISESHDYVDKIIICGNTNIIKSNKVEIISYKKNGQDIRIPISEKKKLILNNATTEFILLIHDHVFIDQHFFKNFINADDLFDVYSCDRYSVQDYPEKYVSHGDIFDYHGSMDAFSYVKKNKENISKIINENTCINGAFICVRKCCIEDINWPTHLQWGDMEDIYISKALHLNGCVLFFDESNHFFASSLRTGKSKFTKDSFPYRTKRLINQLKIKISTLLRNEFY